MARVDTPQLDSIDITYADYFHFQATELSKFIERSLIKPSSFAHGSISFEYDGISFCLLRKTDPDERTIAIKISSCEGIHEEVCDMARVLNQAPAMLSDVVHLEITIDEDRTWELERDYMYYIEWLELFRPFPAVKKLRIHKELAESIVHVLKGQTEEADTQVLPALKSICMKDRPPHQETRFSLTSRTVAAPQATKGSIRTIVTPNRQKERGKMRSQCEGHRHATCATTIDTLTDDILLDIIDIVRCCRTAYEVRFHPVWEWQQLARVCRRWREVIFASPLRLDLQLLCTHGTPVRKDLGYWPPTFPIAIDYGYNSGKSLTRDDEYNMFAALEQRHRVRLLRFSGTNAVLEKMVTLMHGPFPELRRLAISPEDLITPVLTRSFLGGSAPRLREISFSGISFPALPTLLSSASGIVELSLVNIPQTGYISPVAFASCLAALPKLERLFIEFRPLASYTDQTLLPPETRTVLPSLTSFGFEGECTYSEVIVARIDTPKLDLIDVKYTNHLNFRVTELSKFIERSAIKLSRRAEISFEYAQICFYFFRKSDPDSPIITIQLRSINGIFEQVLDMAQALNRTSAMLSDVVYLKISLDDPDLDWHLEDEDDMDNIEWLELLRQFTAVKKLRICEELAESITHALEGQTEEAGTQVLPALKLICVEDQHTRYMEELRH
ncbi:hypothetical protein EDB86DRAFT_3087496 [Lactarius hatsudake]|nr:hypothetical protein EDB86DRAFT_3087496 [Lactarius hatsudake]